MSKKPKIKFLLAQVSKAVIFEIYEMDERFRSREGSPSIIYPAANGFTVTSSRSLSLGFRGLYLWGDEPAHDYRLATIVFDTQEEAKTYQAKVLEALKDWADNWEGWDGKPTESSDDPNVYTFY